MRRVTAETVQEIKRREAAETQTPRAPKWSAPVDQAKPSGTEGRASRKDAKPSQR